MSIRWVVPYAGIPPESLFGATGGLGAPLVLDTTTLTLYTYIAGVGVTAVGGGGGGGGITWTTTTVDFGATPVAEAEFTITDAACTVAKNILTRSPAPTAQPTTTPPLRLWQPLFSPSLPLPVRATLPFPFISCLG